MIVMAKRSVNALTVSFALTVALAAGDASAQALRKGEVLSSVSATVLSAPNPVRGSDGRIHLAYEIAMVNTSHVFVRLDAVDAVDEARHDLDHLAGDRLTASLSRFGEGSGALLAPGASATVFMDVTVADAAALPKQLANRITLSRQAAGPDGKPAPWPRDAPLPAQISFVGARTSVGPAAREIASPLRGVGWVAVNGCCKDITSHRGALLAVNGVLYAPERFAIDWVRLDGDRRVAAGPANELASYRYYGAAVHAVADGVVVNSLDGVDEQVPGEDARGITPETIGGNMLVVDIGGGAFAFFAHLQKGSLRVGRGDRVATGQVIGLLGNTGNSTAPHLHFHLMDGPSPLASNGLPFTLAAFHLAGTVADPADWLGTNAPARVQDVATSGQQVGVMPLDHDVVDFR